MSGAKPADSAELDDEHIDPQPAGDQPKAEPAAEPADAGDQPLDGERSPAARPKAKAEPAQTDGDDVLEEHDPLTKLRKQFVSGESPTPPAPAQPAAKPEPEPGKPDDGAKPEPAKAAAKNEPTRVDDDQVLANLPQEEWAKLSHDGKRHFLTQRKEIVNLRKQRDEITAKEKAAADRETKANEKATRFERFVSEHGLDNEEFGFGVQVMGAIKRNDPRAIPHVENTLRELYKANGKQFPEQAAPAQPPEIEPIKGKLPDDLAELVELHGVPEDEARLLAAVRVHRAQKAKAPPAPAPAAPPAPPAPPANGQLVPDAAEVAVNNAIFSYLEGQGVPREQVLGYVAKNLLPMIPNAGRLPVTDRLDAVVKAHLKHAGTNKPPAAPPATRTPSPQPISGRNGAANGGRKPPTADPLEALQRQWVR